MFAILLCCCQRKFIYDALMALDEISKVHQTNTSFTYIAIEQHIFALPPLPSDYKEEGSAKMIFTLSTLIVVILDVFNFNGYGILHMEKVQVQIIHDENLFSIIPFQKGYRANVPSYIFVEIVNICN